MLRSLFSGISGMRNNQTRLDVIGNNIANVSTTGFKSNRVTFQDLFSQTTSNAQGPTANGTGGINARQVGLGVMIGAIGTNMTGGSLQATGYTFDFAIAGEGFFVVSKEANPTGTEAATASDLPRMYTRDGAFTIDSEGNLVTSQGYRVLGYLALEGDDGITVDPPTDSTAPSVILAGSKDDIAYAPEGGTTDNIYGLKIPLTIVDEEGVETKLSKVSVDESGLITVVYGGNTYYAGRVALATFSNPEGLEKQGNNMYTVSNNSGAPLCGVPKDPGFGEVRQGFLEMSNVDLATEFTEMIITSRAYQANSRTIRTSDEMLQELINLKR